MKKTAAKYDVEGYIQYKHAVEFARWDDVQGKWSLTVRNGDRVFETQCDVFVNAGGVLKCAARVPPTPVRADAITMTVIGNGPMSKASMATKESWFTPRLGMNRTTTLGKELRSSATAHLLYKSSHSWPKASFLLWDSDPRGSCSDNV